MADFEVHAVGTAERLRAVDTLSMPSAAEVRMCSRAFEWLRGMLDGPDGELAGAAMEAMARDGQLLRDRLIAAHQPLTPDRWQQRALRAEGILAAIWRRLDDYRERGQAMPSYAEIVRLLQG